MEETNPQMPNVADLIPPAEGAAPEQAAPAEGAAETPKQPTFEEVQKEFLETLRKPLDPADVKEAKVQALLCDVQIAELHQAIAGLEARIAANRAEIAKCEMAKAIINRRLANKN